MKAAMPAPHPLPSYASRTPARARSAARASGSTGMSGGSCATSVVTSSGCAATRASAVTALAVVEKYHSDVTTLVAHEPPLITLTPDGPAAVRARARVREAYEERGWGAGMAAFVAMTSWVGEFTDAYFAQPAADPAAFGMPTEDDGSRDDPLLSDRSWAVSGYRPDADAITAAPTRVVIAVGEESENLLTARTSAAAAELLGLKVVVFPSHHGGFCGGEFGYPGKPDEFALRLRQVLDGDA